MIRLLKYILPALLLVIAIPIILMIYTDFRSQMTRDFNQIQQKFLHLSIDNFQMNFNMILRHLENSAKSKDVVNLDDNGINHIQFWQLENAPLIKAVTRMDEHGRITYTFPRNPSAIGADISGQEHVANLLGTHKTVISDIFIAVQGYQAIAVHAPVFDENGKFRGSLAVLLSFDDLIRQSTEIIDTEADHFFVLSSRGRIVYNRHSEIIGQLSSQMPLLPDAESLQLDEEKAQGNFVWTIETKSNSQRSYFVNYRSDRMLNDQWTWVNLIEKNKAITGLSQNFRRLTVLLTLLSLLIISFIIYSYQQFLRARANARLTVMEDELKFTRNRFQQLFETMPDAIFISEKMKNQHSKIVSVNPAAIKQTGYSKEELIGNNVAQLLSVDDLNRIERKDRINKIFSGQYSLIEKKRKKDGEEYWSSVHFATMQENDRAYIISVSRDINEQMTLQERLIQSQKMESIGILTGGIAHDFNNILTAINGFAEIGQLSSSDHPTFSELFDNIINSGNHARDLIRQLLVFSKRQDTEQRLLNLDTIVNNLYPMIRRVLKKDIEVDMQLHGDLPGILADPGHMEQILLNLVMNAGDSYEGSGQNKKQIIIRTDFSNESDIPGAEKNRVVLRVIDCGSGIPEDIKDKIFDPFFSTKRHKGTGLGLYTVYKLIDRNKGNIRVESKPGDGTAFIMDFPVSSQLFVDDVEQKQDIAVMKGKETILFVEDNEQIIRFAVNSLTSLGYSVITAENGRAAIEKINSGADPDLIISDLDMPVMNGIEFIKYLEEQPSHPPLILCSGYADTLPGFDELMEKYQNFFLNKPYTIKELHRKMREALET